MSPLKEPYEIVTLWLNANLVLQAIPPGHPKDLQYSLHKTRNENSHFNMALTGTELVLF